MTSSKHNNRKRSTALSSPRCAYVHRPPQCSVKDLEFTEYKGTKSEYLRRAVPSLSGGAKPGRDVHVSKREEIVARLHVSPSELFDFYHRQCKQ